MSMEHESEGAALEQLLDAASGPEPSTESFRGILARHSRRRRRLTGGIAATVLVAGLGGGVAIGELVATGSTIAASGQTGRVPRGSNPSTFGTDGTGGSAPSIGAPSIGGQTPKTRSGLSITYGSAHAPVENPALPAASGAGHPTGTSPEGFGTACTANGCYWPYTPTGIIFETGLRPLFDRSSNGVEVRAFTVSYPETPIGVPEPSTASPPTASPPASSVAPGASGSSSGASVTSGVAFSGPSADPVGSLVRVCNASSALVVEVSDPAAIGEVSVPDDGLLSSKPLALVSDQVVGTAEGSPMAVVAVRAGPGVSEVTASFGGGRSDTMAVVDGWAVLVSTLPDNSSALASEGAATVAALSSSGVVLGEIDLAQAPAVAIPSLCIEALPVHGPQPLQPGKGNAATTSGGAPSSVAGSPGTTTTTTAGATRTGVAPAVEPFPPGLP